VFTAEVLSAQSGGHAVVVPKDVAATFSSKRPLVLAHINGVEYRSRLMIYGSRSSSPRTGRSESSLSHRS
jgi:hypothetical protein